MTCPMHKVLWWGAFAAVAAPVVMRLRAHRRKLKRIPQELTAARGVEDELAARLELATALALAAGAAIMKAIDGEKDIESKGVSTDIVTATDKANEELIFSALAAAFPDDKLIGEESSAEAGKIEPVTKEGTWIIDPIDGTTNFTHSFPMVCVSIGFVRDGETQLGVVYSPSCSDDLFQAVRGHGTFLNGRRVHASQATALEHSLVIQEYGYPREPEALDTMLAVTSKVLPRTRGMRQVGSGALDLAYVACGRVDAVFSGFAGEGWKPWDYAAGWLLAEEAGACTTQVDGSPFHLLSESVLCSCTQSLADEIMEVVK
ncbi:unnamed protein product [Chrysoparadoxa australica]